MLFELLIYLHQIAIGLGHFLFKFIDMHGRPYPGNYILTLSIDETFGKELSFARRRVSGKAYTGAGSVPDITEDHRLDIARSTKII